MSHVAARMLAFNSRRRCKSSAHPPANIVMIVATIVNHIVMRFIVTFPPYGMSCIASFPVLCALRSSFILAPNFNIRSFCPVWAIPNVPLRYHHTRLPRCVRLTFGYKCVTGRNVTCHPFRCALRRTRHTSRITYDTWYVVRGMMVWYVMRCVWYVVDGMVLVRNRCCCMYVCTHEMLWNTWCIPRYRYVVGGGGSVIPHRS